MKKLILIVAMSSLSIGAKAANGDAIAGGGALHKEYTEVTIASELCPGVAFDIKKWDAEVRKVAGSNGPGWIKAFVVSEQGEAWYGKRYDEYQADKSKNCAAAEEDYGPKGKGLLKRK